MYLIIIIVVVLAAAFIGSCVYGSNVAVHYKNQRDPDRWRNNAQYYESCEKRSFSIMSRNLKICGEFLPTPSSKRSNKIAILVHGVTATRKTISDYVPLFHRMGFGVIIYDQPNHGQSGGKMRTYGVVESIVLKDIYSYARSTLEAGEIGFWGISMGGATVLMAAPDLAVDFVIADCSYDSFENQFESQMHNFSNLKGKTATLFTKSVSQINRLRFGWSFSDAAPIKRICEIAAPVLLIHGEKDGFVNAKMSRRMFDKRLSCNCMTDLKLFDAGHAASFYSDEIAYENTLSEFVEKAYDAREKCR